MAASLVALALAQVASPPVVTPPGSPVVPMTVAPPVTDPVRIALTPTLDGAIGAEEWDPLSQEGEVASYFQWQPNTVHVAAKLPPGQDLVLSLDLGANGWLIGDDNLEIRLTSEAGTVKTVARLLDATNVDGPVWVPLPGFALSTRGAVGTDGTSNVIEASATDPGLGLLKMAPGKPFGVRVDTAPTGGMEAQAFLPRVLAQVQPGYYRSAGLPAGLAFKPEGEARSVVPGQSLFIRLTFQGKSDLGVTRLVMNSEGPARAVTNLIEVPFPPFDRRGRAFVDYSTNIAPEATEGYRLLRGTLGTQDGVPGVAQMSYRIAPYVDAELVRQDLKTRDMDRSHKFTFYLKSNSGRSVGGQVAVSVPDPLRVLNGSTRRFEIGRPRGGSRQVFDLYLPANASGTFPVTFSFKIGPNEYTQTGYLAVP